MDAAVSIANGIRFCCSSAVRLINAMKDKNIEKSINNPLAALSRMKSQVSRDTNKEFDEKLTFGQKLADKVAAFGGSWTFILLSLGVMGFWILLNSILLVRQGEGPFDPYPYILLNLVLSMCAALQAPVIMMSQNRQGAKDRLDAEHDYEVNLKSEVELLRLHEKIDDLKEKQWQDLIALQQKQIDALNQLLSAGSKGAGWKALDQR